MKQIKTKKEFTADSKIKAQDLRCSRRQIEKEIRKDVSSSEDVEGYKFDSIMYLGEVYGVFEFMGWGHPPKILTDGIEISECG